ncbi:MAG: hypothetical protein ACREPL_06015 [Rhodanobacteraceae bacterium]
MQDLIAHDADTSAYQIAEVYALRGNPDEMFHWLNRAWVQSDTGIQGILSDPFILRYRADPRFAAFCKQVGLLTITDAVAMKQRQNMPNGNHDRAAPVGRVCHSAACGWLG